MRTLFLICFSGGQSLDGIVRFGRANVDVLDGMTFFLAHCTTLDIP